MPDNSGGVPPESVGGRAVFGWRKLGIMGLMKHPATRSHHVRPLIIILAGLTFSLAAAAEPCRAAEPIDGIPIVTGYADYEAMRLQLESIAESKYATLRSLGRTRGDRDVFLLSIGAKRRDDVPAILLLGNVEPSHLLGSELAVRVARQLVDRAATDKSVRKMLATTTVYVIPRPAPDACEAFFRQPYAQRSGNERPTDDDRDGQIDEDGPDDLDGDGLITMMRIEDPSGPYMPHPNDDRILIEADAKQGEQGRYRLAVEGRDNDGDEKQGEDPAGGVAFNRNFTFRYPYYSQGAGPHQVCEPETRAVADFAFSHPNIAAMLTFTAEDNLMRPWKPGSGKASGTGTTVLSDDAKYLDRLAEQYAEIHEGKDPPKSPQGEGSLSEWAYYHFGRWSLGCRGWWIPQVEEPEETPEEESEKEEEKPSSEKRGAAELNALRWFAQEKIDGFVDWHPVEHPDFPDEKVEVGGFKPFLRSNPPADRLEPLAEKHWQFLRLLARSLPKVVIRRAVAEPLGRGVWRVKALVANEGYLPTMSAMGRKSHQPHPLQIQLRLPPGASLVTGNSRSQLAPLAGHGGKIEHTWLVLLPDETPKSLRVRVWSPTTGTQTAKPIKTKANQP